jgi:hypothetical protein
LRAAGKDTLPLRHLSHRERVASTIIQRCRVVPFNRRFQLSGIRLTAAAGHSHGVRQRSSPLENNN